MNLEEIAGILLNAHMVVHQLDVVNLFTGKKRDKVVIEVTPDRMTNKFMRLYVDRLSQIISDTQRHIMRAQFKKFCVFTIMSKDEFNEFKNECNEELLSKIENLIRR